MECSAPCRSDLGEPSALNRSCSLHYPRTKVRQVRGEDTTIARQLPPVNPLDALEAHLLLSAGPADLPLFSYDSPNGFVNLTKKPFLKRCNEVWKKNGIPCFTSHSFRIGGTTHLLRSGISPEVVKRAGRWSSDSFLRYWRDDTIIVPLHTGLIPISTEASAGLSGGVPRGRPGAAAPSPG